MAHFVKALPKSIIRQVVCLPLSRFLVISSRNSTSWVSQDSPFRNPCCNGCKRLCLSACAMMLLVMICSIILHTIQISDTYRAIVYSIVFLAFLVDGTDESCFPNTGYFPCVIGLLVYDIVNNGDIWLASSFKTLGAILSGQGA